MDALDRLSWSAPKHDIRKQYLKISRQVHPDRFVNDDEQSKRAAHCFNLVRTAYDTLTDDVTREQYLSALQQTRKQHRDADALKDDVDDNHNNTRDEPTRFKLKRSRRRQIIEKEADEYAKQVMNEFHERRQRSKMKHVRAAQITRRQHTQTNKTASDTVNDGGDDGDSAEDIDIEHDYLKTLTKLKRKQKNGHGKKRTF
eukprot:CAMPEP_0202707650 /NCGR_PEP_ID=MMETSP1385-20130828/19951_1 /ASSEMBLY_ACC=CAM_ASM_000861 /TAXON_ID=933848 /ORGANISM="Elphidium margaritaceum" /LENGTH=199 /DNA_ID=CAMNT_0049366405 /DNA_START=108 /DNA_END=707 /DNA_ORIENTATION=-